MVLKLQLVFFLLVSNILADQHFYVTKKGENCIERYSLNSQTGELTFAKRFDLKAGPSMLVLSPDKKHFNFSLSSDGSSELGTAKILENGDLEFIGSNIMQAGGGGLPSKDGRFLYKYHYARNIVSVLEMKNNLHTGKQIQEIKTTKNPHDIGISNDGSMIFVPHNGQNRLYQFKIDQKSGKLLPMNPPYLEGAKFEEKGFAAFRSLAFHPTQNVVYCTYEKGGGVASLKYDSNGLKLWQEFSTTEKGNKVLPTVVAITPNKKFLYVPNRHGKKGGSSIAAFKLDPKSGKILNRIGIFNYSAVGPRGMSIDNTGQFLFTSSVRTGSIFQFKINENGSLNLQEEHKIPGGGMVMINK